MEFSKNVCGIHAGSEDDVHFNDREKIKILEKYVSNLEKLVDDRTKELNNERRRAEIVLYQSVPRTVADSLKQGKRIDAEIFESATIYFSDIVGCTTICFSSKPNEFVDMLNSLYSLLDDIIMKHEAYKVDVIGDSYLVVGGVPVRNGKQHVTEIPDMALEIVTALKECKAQRFPPIRIGLHSGKIGGGVVGLTVPRYFLFGKSLTYAARMEGSSEPGKILISEDTAKNLRANEGYIIAKNKKVEIKGKGYFETFWLEGKDETSSVPVFDV